MLEHKNDLAFVIFKPHILSSLNEWLNLELFIYPKRYLKDLFRVLASICFNRHPTNLRVHKHRLVFMSVHDNTQIELFLNV